MTALRSRILLWLLGFAALPFHSDAGTYRALDYQTPAYIDFELSEIVIQPGATSAVVNIYRTGDFRQYTRLEFVTEEVTAVEGRDYKGTGGTLTFAPGEGYKSVIVDILSDRQRECTFRLRLKAISTTAMLMRESVDILIQAAPAPLLTISPGANSTIVLSWSGGENLVLERSANPASGQWEEVTAVPVLRNGSSEVSQAAGGTFYAYRLRAR